MRSTESNDFQVKRLIGRVRIATIATVYSGNEEKTFCLCSMHDASCCTDCVDSFLIERSCAVRDFFIA